MAESAALAAQASPLLAPFFAGEAGYCHLLHVLLTAPTQLARDFRKAFSERVLQPKFNTSIGDKAVDVRSEAMISGPGEGSQTIDLVISLEHDTIGVEVKIFAASARKGQLAAQYRLLRAKTPSEIRVHSLLIFPNPTNHHAEVKVENGGDRAESVTWSEIFECLPPRINALDPDVLLASIIEQARIQQQVLRAREPKTIVTPERRRMKEEMDRTLVRFARALSGMDEPLRGCTWKPNFWRDPRMDAYYGPLISPEGEKLLGQYLSLRSLYAEPPAPDPAGEISVCVVFTLERKGGAKIYQTEFDAAFPECIKHLPPPADQHRLGKEHTEVLHELSLIVTTDQITTAAGVAADVALADLLLAYARAFSSFLLRDVRVPKKIPAKAAV